MSTQTPTIGRRVYYWPLPSERECLPVPEMQDSKLPFDAGIIYVWNSGEISVVVTDPRGLIVSYHKVHLADTPEAAQPGECSWMPPPSGASSKARVNPEPWRFRWEGVCQLPPPRLLTGNLASKNRTREMKRDVS